MKIEKESARGLLVTWSDERPLRSYPGGPFFWEDSNQQVICAELAPWLPPVHHEHPNKFIRVTLMQNGQEMLSGSRSLADPGVEVPESEIQLLQEAVERFLRKMTARYTAENVRSLMECFALPNPQKAPELYRLYGSPEQPRLAIIWGIHKGTPIPLKDYNAYKLLRKRPFRPWLWLKWLLFLLLLLLLIAGVCGLVSKCTSTDGPVTLVPVSEQNERFSLNGFDFIPLFGEFLTDFGHEPPLSDECYAQRYDERYAELKRSYESLSPAEKEQYGGCFEAVSEMRQNAPAEPRKSQLRWIDKELEFRLRLLEFVPEDDSVPEKFRKRRSALKERIIKLRKKLLEYVTSQSGAGTSPDESGAGASSDESGAGISPDESGAGTSPDESGEESGGWDSVWSGVSGFVNSKLEPLVCMEPSALPYRISPEAAKLSPDGELHVTFCIKPISKEIRELKVNGKDQTPGKTVNMLVTPKMETVQISVVLEDGTKYDTPVRIIHFFKVCKSCQ